MVNSIYDSIEKKGPPPAPDETWWEAVLAEDEACNLPYTSRCTVPENDNQTSSEEPPASIDWEKANQLYEQDQVVTLQVTGYNRGGLLVAGDGLQGFVPVSHLIDMPDDKDAPASWLEDYQDHSITLKVIECDAERGRVVFSERAAQSSPGSRKNLLQSLKIGDCTCGIVTNITDFGVFVDLGGVEGLVHVSEISWGRVHHPEDVVKLGQNVQVHVIQIDRQRARVALSLKRLCPNPWETAHQRYFPGQVTQATVTSLVSFGAFARLDEGLDGLIHISEMNCAGHTRPEDVLHEGQQVQVRVLHVDAARQRLGLSLHLADSE